MEDDPFMYRRRNNQSGGGSGGSGGSTSGGRQTAFVSPVTDSLQPSAPSKIDDEDAYLYGSSNSGGLPGSPGGFGGGNVAFASRRKPGGPEGGNRNFTDNDYGYGDRGFRDLDFEYRSSGQSGYQSGGGVLDDLRGDFDGGRGTPQRQDRDITDDIFLPRGGPTLKRQRREDSPPRGFGGGFGGGGFKRGPPRDYDRVSCDDRGGNYRGNNIRREYSYDDRGGYPATGANTVSFGQRVDGPPKSILKNSGSFQPPAPTPFDKSQYPQKGSLRIENEAELAKSRPAVYELPKIQKKQKTPEEENVSQSEKLAQLRMEHAKLEIMINQLQTLIDRTVTKENEIKRNFKGQSLSENKEFVDNMKLRTDAQRKLDDMRKDYEFKDTIIKKMMEPRVEQVEKQEEEEGQGSNQVAPGVTDFLSQREEVLEETDDKYEFFDGGEHWCQSCNFFGGNVKEFLEHLQTEDHFTTSSSKQAAPWPMIRRNPSKAPDRSLVAIKGSQFIIPCKGYYCAICRMFCGDIESGEEHLYSLMHNKSMIKFGITKPEYEFIFNKDKMAAKNKAEADRRKKERDAIEKRNREAEERKRKEEEERKRKEREMREKANQDNLQRLKELENKRKEKERRERERDRERDRDPRHRKDKKRIHINDSSASSSDDDIEVVSRPSRGVAVTVQKERPEDDPKIKAGCMVAIPYIEARTTRKVFEKTGKKVTYLAKVLVLVGNSIEDQKWVSQKPMNKGPHQEAFGSATSPAVSSPSAVCSPSEESQQKSSSSLTFQPLKPKIVAEFDDDNDDEFNLTSVTEGKRNDYSDMKDSSTDKNAEGDEEDSKKSTTAMSNEKDKSDRNSQTSGDCRGDKSTYDKIFSAISTEKEDAGEDTPMKTDASTDKATSITTTDLTSTTTSSSLSPTKRIGLPAADDDSSMLITGDMCSPKKTTSLTKAILSSSMRNVDSPITTLDLDVLTKSPTYDEEDDDD